IMLALCTALRQNKALERDAQPEANLDGFSTRRRLWPVNWPSFFASCCRSTERIWLTMTAERLGRALSSGSVTSAKLNWKLRAGGLEAYFAAQARTLRNQIPSLTAFERFRQIAIREFKNAGIVLEQITVRKRGGEMDGRG